VAVPPPLIKIHPEWRGHMYFVVGDQIIVKLTLLTRGTLLPVNTETLENKEPDMDDEKPRRGHGRPSRAEASRKALAGIDPASRSRAAATHISAKLRLTHRARGRRGRSDS
jgi:hypothetical protein